MDVVRELVWCRDGEGCMNGFSVDELQRMIDWVSAIRESKPCKIACKHFFHPVNVVCIVCIVLFYVQLVATRVRNKDTEYILTTL